jgi:hypothetical protein
MDTHEKLAAILNAAFGALGVIIALVIALAIAGSGILSGDPEAIRATAIISVVISGFIMLLSVPQFVAGVAFLYGKKWARIMLLVIGALQLVNIPFGTVLGAYTLWALLSTKPVSGLAPMLSQ